MSELVALGLDVSSRLLLAVGAVLHPKIPVNAAVTNKNLREISYQHVS